MKHNLVLLIVFLFYTGFQTPVHEGKTFEAKVTSEELKLYDLIMAYRKSKNLPPIPLSKSLIYVAHEHCKDLFTNKPDIETGCNAHSWSGKGKWSGCCFTDDYKESKCMWNKPRELTNYEGDGFEIACGSSDPAYKEFVMTADYALKSWKQSYYHNIVIINEGMWKDFKWNAIGIGVYNGFAVVWFGEPIDKDGQPTK